MLSKINLSYFRNRQETQRNLKSIKNKFNQNKTQKIILKTKLYSSHLTKIFHKT